MRPLSAQQQEYQTEEQALAAVNDAIPHIAKAAHMVQTVCMQICTPALSRSDRVLIQRNHVWSWKGFGWQHGKDV